MKCTLELFTANWKRIQRLAGHEKYFTESKAKPSADNMTKVTVRFNTHEELKKVADHFYTAGLLKCDDKNQGPFAC